MNSPKLFKLAKLFEKRAIDNPPQTQPEGWSDEQAPSIPELEGPSTLREYTGDEPPEEIAPEERDLKHQLENPINLTIENGQLKYILNYLIRNVQRDRAAIEKRYRGNVPDYEFHKVKHLNNVDNIIQYIQQFINP